MPPWVQLIHGTNMKLYRGRLRRVEEELLRDTFFHLHIRCLLRDHKQIQIAPLRLEASHGKRAVQIDPYYVRPKLLQQHLDETFDLSMDLGGGIRPIVLRHLSFTSLITISQLP